MKTTPTLITSRQTLIDFLRPTRLLCLAAVCSFAALTGSGQPSGAGVVPSVAEVGAAKTGVIVGTVINKNTHRFLERASIEVDGLGIQVLTDMNGEFRISGVSAGTYTLWASYTGLNRQRQTVTVAAGAPTRVEFELTTEIYTLDEVVVSSQVEGSAYAVNQQRRAPSTRTITSIDAFIDQVTGNPGEFLKNVEGIQMDYSQNEPQTIRVRGFDPTLTVVTMDGNPIASAASSSASRAVQIDQLSIASIDSVEVYKAPIPWISANSIGGSVNFKTKSAFDQKGRRAFAQVGVNMDSNDFTWRKSPGPGHGEEAERRIYPAARFEYSNAFLGNRLGLVFSLGHDHTNQLGSSTTHNLNVHAVPGGNLPAAPTLYTPTNTVIRRGAFSMAPNRQLRVRSDISLNMDFRLTDDITLFLRTTYTKYKSTNRNHGFTLSPGTLAPGATSTEYTATTGSASQSTSIFNKYTNTTQLTPGVTFRRGDWRAELVGGFSKSTNHYKNPDTFTGLGTNLPNVSWSMRAPADDDKPTSITQTGGLDFYDLNNYAPSQGSLVSTAGEHRANHNGFVNNNHRDSWNGQFVGRLDVQRDFHTQVPFYVKAGVAYNEAIFDKTQSQKRWYWMGDDGAPTADDFTAAGAQLGRFAEPVPVTQNIPGWDLREPTYLSSQALYRYWRAHPQVLRENEAYSAQQRIRGLQKTNERINAAYLAADIKWKKLEVLTGVRVEETRIKTQGYERLPVSGANSVLPAGVDANSLQGILLSERGITSRSSYRSDPFPYLHLTYEWLPGLITRAAYTEAIGRPNLSDLVPGGMSVDYSTGVITANNRAGLLPQRSQNLDCSVEYYTKGAGQWTFGVFARDVEDYITSVQTAMTPDLLEELNLDSQFRTFQVRTRTNMGQAKWSGYEAKFTQSLREYAFMPKLLHGVTLWANYTKIAKMKGDFGNQGVIITKLANVVPELINAGVSYRSPRGDFFVQLSTNYQTAKPTQNMPAAAAAAQRAPQQEPYQFWNLEMSYRVTPRVRLTCTGRNLFSERPIFSEMGIIRNTQQATGIAWLFSTRVDL